MKKYKLIPLLNDCWVIMNIEVFTIVSYHTNGIEAKTQFIQLTSDIE